MKTPNPYNPKSIRHLLNRPHPYGVACRKAIASGYRAKRLRRKIIREMRAQGFEIRYDPNKKETYIEPG